MKLSELNGLDPGAAAAILLQVCGSTTWARTMAAERPFDRVAEASEAADRVWRGLECADWLEAFAAHPRIGSGRSRGSGGLSEWSRQEQAGMTLDDDGVLARLAEANRAYETRFGYIFIICATGRSGAEILAECERRLANGPDAELAVASEEQRRIMQLRIAKLFE